MRRTGASGDLVQLLRYPNYKLYKIPIRRTATSAGMTLEYVIPVQTARSDVSDDNLLLLSYTTGRTDSD
jgi:hypothetical protein